METTATNHPERTSVAGKSPRRAGESVLASLDRSFRGFHEGLRGGVIFSLVPIVGCLDFLSGEQLSFSVFYLAPVALSARYQRGRVPYLCAGFAGIVWLAVEIYSHSVFSNPLIPYWNAASRTGFFVLLVAFMRVLSERDARLEMEVQRQTVTLREMISSRKTLEREMAQAVAQEHSQIARELHDGVGQYLAGLAFRARGLADGLKQDGSSLASRAEELVDKLAITNRMLRRLDHILTPSIAAEGGLSLALERLAADVRRFSGIECTLSLPDATFVIGEFQALSLFRIAQEAINNSVKHGGTGSVRVDLVVDDPGLRLTVADDGRGFTDPADLDSGEGLRIMRHRAELIGARLEIRSTGGSGCTVECVLPWRGASPVLHGGT